MAEFIYTFRGDILWCVLMGFIAVWAGDLFHAWEPMQKTIEDWWKSWWG